MDKAKIIFDKMTGIPASVGITEPAEGYAVRPQDAVKAMEEMADRIEAAETELDALKIAPSGKAPEDTAARELLAWWADQLANAAERDLPNVIREGYARIINLASVTAVTSQADKPQLTEMQRKALELYKPPFKFTHGYIFDAEHHMFSDNGNLEDRAAGLARIRGWGRLSYLENPEQLQDAAGDLYALALTQFWEANSNA